jgi:hypothetical protein
MDVDFVAGVAFDALNLRQVSSIVRVEHDVALTPEDFSLAFWAHSPQVSLDFPEVLISKGRDCWANYQCALIPGGSLRCLINDGRGWCEDGLSVSAPWPELSWNHVVFTVEQNVQTPEIRLRLFVNGVLADSLDVADVHVVDTPDWHLLFGGHYQEPGGVGVTPYLSHAWLDETQLYDRALTGTEAEGLHDAFAH